MSRLWEYNNTCTETQPHEIHDQIAAGSGSGSLSSRSSRPRSLFLQVFTLALHTTTTLCDSGAQTVLQNRFSRCDTNAPGFRRTPKQLAPQEHPTLFDALLCRTTAAKKKVFESLLNAVFERAEEMKMISEKPEGAIDSTGFETRHIEQSGTK